MNASDVWDEIPANFKNRNVSGILLVLCTEGEPLIYRTMNEQHFQQLLEMLKTVKEPGQCATN